jgi:rhamnulokinase
MVLIPDLVGSWLTGRPAAERTNASTTGLLDATMVHVVMGLWLLQESMRTWAEAGEPADLERLLAGAEALPSGGPIVDPNDPAFLPPGDMPARIAAALHRNGQPAPSNREALVRCILDSLAAAFAYAVHDAARLSGRRVGTVHLVGGGARNDLLCRLTAHACGLPVVAGPVEATALGNVLVQARATGWIAGDLEGLRAGIRTTHALRRYEPERRPAAVSSTP